MKYLNIICLLTGLGMSLATVGCTHAVKTGSNNSGQTAGSTGKSPARTQVAMLEFHFRPESLNVWTGETVTWVNHGRAPHTTTSEVNGTPDGLWDSKHIERGGSFSYVFLQPGTYRYFCSLHRGLGMKGVIVVTNR